MAGYGMCILTKKSVTEFFYFPVSIHVQFPQPAAVQHSPVSLEQAAGATGKSTKSVILQSKVSLHSGTCSTESTKLFLTLQQMFRRGIFPK